MQIRPATLADAPGIAKVHVDTWRTTYTGLVPDEHLANLRYDRSANIWQRILTEWAETNFVYITEDTQGQIVGFASGGPEQKKDTVYDGELYAIYILEDAQGQGIGRQLTQAIAQHLLDAGFKGMKIWVLKGNASRGFYEALGGKVIGEKEEEISGQPVIEIAYGWPDVRTLLPEKD